VADGPWRRRARPVAPLVSARDGVRRPVKPCPSCGAPLTVAVPPGYDREIRRCDPCAVWWMPLSLLRHGPQLALLRAGRPLR
jgi:hypothetical protein